MLVDPRVFLIAVRAGAPVGFYRHDPEPQRVSRRARRPPRLAWGSSRSASARLPPAQAPHPKPAGSCSSASSPRRAGSGIERRILRRGVSPRGRGGLRLGRGELDPRRQRAHARRPRTRGRRGPVPLPRVRDARERRYRFGAGGVPPVTVPARGAASDPAGASSWRRTSASFSFHHFVQSAR